MSANPVKAVGVPDDFLALERVVRSRRSVRGFLPDPVPMQTCKSIFSLAQAAPSNCNTQPWLVRVVSGERQAELRTKLIEAVTSGQAPAPDFQGLLNYPGIHRDRQVDAARQLYGAMGIARDDQKARSKAALRNFEFFGAPHVALIFVPDWVQQRELADCGLYAQTLMLAMTAFGVASCPQAALGYYPAVVRSVLDIDPATRLLYGISFGFEDPSVAANATRVGRVPLDETTVFLD
ncbi:MAG: nitroreductase [Novosphingobium sp.]